MHQTQEFSINIPSIDQVKEADYCGIVSGSNTDKLTACGFKVFFGKLANAPLLEQCPVNLACRVEHVLSLGTHQLFVGRVEETYVTDICLTDGKPDFSKIRPLIFGMAPRAYFGVGALVSPAFVNKEFKKQSC